MLLTEATQKRHQDWKKKTQKLRTKTSNLSHAKVTKDPSLGFTV